MKKLVLGALFFSTLTYGNEFALLARTQKNRLESAQQDQAYYRAQLQMVALERELNQLNGTPNDNNYYAKLSKSGATVYFEIKTLSNKPAINIEVRASINLTGQPRVLQFSECTIQPENIDVQAAILKLVTHQFFIDYLKYSWIKTPKIYFDHHLAQTYGFKASTPNSLIAKVKEKIE